MAMTKIPAGDGMNYAIRGTDRCNLDCDYCYARVPNPQDMSLETLRLVLTEIAQNSSGKITISWTGGEPTLLGRKFFETIMEVQRDFPNIEFTNILQTNLTLLDDWFINFLAVNDWQVRTSLDLPAEHHDLLRIRGNFARTLAKIKRLQAVGIPVNINTVITNRNVYSAAKIYEFLKANQITSFSVSRFILQGNAKDNEHLAIREDGRFGLFLIELFDLWMNDPEGHLIQRITPLENLLRACKLHLENKPNPNACFHCQQQIVAIGPTGDIFPSCNKFFGFPTTCLGNIATRSLSEVMESEERKAFLAKVREVTRKICSGCEFIPICKGGCFYVAYAALPELDRITGREQFCKGYYLLFAHIIEYLKRKESQQETDHV